MIGNPLITTPPATNRSRSGSAGGPLLFTPSPETSITCRVPSNGHCPRTSPLNRNAPDKLVHDRLFQGFSPNASAQALASPAVPIRVQGSSNSCFSNAAHSTYATATAPTAPPWIAANTSLS